VAKLLSIEREGKTRQVSPVPIDGGQTVSGTGIAREKVSLAIPAAGNLPERRLAMKTATLQKAAKPLLALTAADLMSAPLMTIAPETSLREAARLLSGSHISGAPVVDREGRCLGVVSSSDFVTCVGTGGEATGKRTKVTFMVPWGEMIDIEESPDDEIRRYMTAQPVTVAPETPIGEIAQKMVDAHIHRVLVVVEQDRPLGIVTSTDILAAVAQAAKRASRRGKR
jgi:CBS domain-containing protein